VWTAAGRAAEVMVCIVHGGGRLSDDDRARLGRWLGAKYGTDKVKIYVE
jgi:hypothetical protein